MSCDHFAWLSTGSTDSPMIFVFRRSNSGLMLAMEPSSVVHTGVKSRGWENRTPHESPSQSWNLIRPSVVSASKSGAVSPIVNAMPSSLPVVELGQSRSIFSAYSVRGNVLARLDGPVRVAAPLRPRPRVEAAVSDSRALHDEQGVARRHARAAGRHHPSGPVDAHRRELAPELVDREEAAGRIDVLARGQASGAGDVARARVERIRLAEVPLALARVERDVRGVGGVVRGRDAVGRPRRRCEGLAGALPRRGAHRPPPRC